MHRLGMEVLNKILAACGPGKLLYIGTDPAQVVRSLLRRGADAFGVAMVPADVAPLADRICSAPPEALPFDDDAFDTLVVHYATGAMTATALAALGELHRVCRRYLIFVLEDPSEPQRGEWEYLAFRGGFRKHPAYYRFTSYAALQDAPHPLLIPLEKLPPSLVAARPLENLLPDRALHMDMSRETGPRSDAHMARYDLAAQWIRAGDSVLDCACGLGYGTAMLANLSLGSRFLGVDLGAEAVAYARDCFADGERTNFRQGDAANLSFVADCSIDTLVSFETMEHLPDYDSFLREVRRILKPDGRIIVSVPNLWHDETGKDPNPYHFHVFDLGKIANALMAAGFIIEARYAQSAPGGFKLTDAPRSLERRPISADPAETDTEWWLLVASVDPRTGKGVPYAHPDFDRSACGPGFVVTDFASHYDNPWLYRPMVQMGERLSDTAALGELARQILGSAAADTADYGAALTVQGYLALDRESPDDAGLDGFLAKARAYCSLTPANPHVLRWQVSLAYLSALLTLQAGRRAQALGHFSAVAGMDISTFSPLLATKTVASSFWAGILRLVDGDQPGARRDFQSGVEIARRALHAPDQNAIGNPLDPLTFGFPELAEVADMASQCTNALHHLDDFQVSPGKFWRAVDIRRFGLATWALGLEKELKGSHAALEKAHAALSQIEALWHERSPLARLINRTLEKLLGLRLVRTRTLDRFRSNSE